VLPAQRPIHPPSPTSCQLSSGLIHAGQRPAGGEGCAYATPRSSLPALGSFAHRDSTRRAFSRRRCCPPVLHQTSSKLPCMLHAVQTPASWFRTVTVDATVSLPRSGFLAEILSVALARSPNRLSLTPAKRCAGAICWLQLLWLGLTLSAWTLAPRVHLSRLAALAAPNSRTLGLPLQTVLLPDIGALCPSRQTRPRGVASILMCAP
jgi:hypothetical protein